WGSEWTPPTRLSGPTEAGPGLRPRLRNGALRRGAEGSRDRHHPLPVGVCLPNPIGTPHHHAVSVPRDDCQGGGWVGDSSTRRFDGVVEASDIGNPPAPVGTGVQSYRI